MTGGVGSQNLDTRLLRFRSRGGDEHAVALVEDLLAAGRHGDAQEVVGASLKAAPSDGDLLLLDGRTRFASGDLLGAQSALLKAARSLPKRKDPFRWLGEVLLKRGDPGRAAKVLERAQAIDGSDRAVQLLLDRAKRLERVAENEGAPRPATPTPAPAAPSPPKNMPFAEASEERTVIRRDLTEELRTLSREEKARERAAATPPAAPLTSPDSTEDFDFEDGPTNVSSLPPRAQEMTSEGRREPTPVSPRIKRTLGFGTPAKDIPPPKRRAPSPPERPPEPPPPFAFDDPSARPPAAPVHTPTSPGAAMAPEPPPPRRRLPSAREATPVAEHGGLPPGDPSPWDGLSDEVNLDSPPPAAGAPPSAAASVPLSRPEPIAPASASPFPSAEPLAPRPAAFPPAPEPSVPELDPFPAPGGPAEIPARASTPEPAAPEVAPDVVASRRDAEDVGEILAMLEQNGLFEPPSDAGASWATKKDVKAVQTTGTRIGLWIGIVWVLGIGLVVGGYFGWQAWLDRNHARSAELLAAATEEAYAGDHADLVDAERHLREARDLNPHDISVPTLLLFVHAQRALEDGAFSAGYIRPTIARAETLEGEEIATYLSGARAVLAAADGDQEQARVRIAAALEARPRDPAILYLAGRLEQRLGGEDALTHLEAATEGAENLNAPRIALAEARYDEGQAQEALALLEQVLANDMEHLRARLWRAFMTADDGEPAELLPALEQIAENLQDHGAPTDHVVYHLTRARLLRRQGQTEAAGEAVDRALRAGASEPRLLAVVAIEGRRAGRMVHAEHAAQTALRGAPSNPDFRKLLAEIQLARRNGRSALATLAELPGDDPDVIEMRAQAALLLGTEEALATAAEGLDAYVEGAEEPSIGARALHVRVHVRMGQAAAMLPVARELAADAPGDPSASLALGEAALRAYDSATAVEALTTVVSASPDDAEGHYLLGRARRMAADGEGARASLERAIELTPEHREAKMALGGLLLDLGEYEAADALYSPLARSARGVVASAGRLGRVEALVGLGRLDDAQVQLEGMREEARDTPSARVVSARLLLAQGQAGAALQRIRPVATGENVSASVLALYGDALLAARQVEPAANAYAAAVEADSGSPEGLLGQADMAVRSERGSDAIELLDRLRRTLERRIRPPSLRARMRTLYGRAYLLGGREDAARRELEAAIESEAAPPEAHFFLGEALSGGNSADARVAYERYLELAPEGPFAARARRAIR